MESNDNNETDNKGENQTINDESTLPSIACSVLQNGQELLLAIASNAVVLMQFKRFNIRS